MTEAIIIVVFIMFFLWMIWRLIISRFISDQRVINGTIIILVFANLILLIFSHNPQPALLLNKEQIPVSKKHYVNSFIKMALQKFCLNWCSKTSFT